jgi:hypothetical protein
MPFFCAETNVDSSTKVRSIIEKAKVVELSARVVEDEVGNPDNDYCRGFNAASTGAVFLSENELVYFGCMKACKDIFDYGFN